MPEIKFTFLNAQVKTNLDLGLLDRFSSWPRLLRVIAFARRWSPRFSPPLAPKRPTFSVITESGQVHEIAGLEAEEIRTTRTQILAQLQAVLFPIEIDLVKRGLLLPKANPTLSLPP